VKAPDQGSSLFWLLLSIYVSVESLRLGIGTLRSPGMGFMTFWTSVLLGALSLVLFVQAFLRKEESKTNPPSPEILWKRIVFVLIALLIYSAIMPTVGYLISTFLLMGSLFWILKRTNWWWALTSSLITTIATYFVFSKWLNCQFPDGFFGF
jgi:putative tricarboxylic transport membrane protein